MLRWESVTEIYHHYKDHGYNTVVMGASFRNTGEIESLAGCDRLTISPALLDALRNDMGALPRRLNPSGAVSAKPEALSESDFRYQLNGDPMATEKLADGIRQFAKDQIALETLIAQTN